jgi:chromate transporter
MEAGEVTSKLWALARIFSELSLLSIGGGNAILPEMQRQIVETQHWMTAKQFGATFALAQAAPGPNIMIVPLLGWRIAGAFGLAVASAAMFAPSSILTILFMNVWERFESNPWRSRIQRGLVPIAAGLVAASAAVIVRSSAQGWGPIAIVLICAFTMSTTRLHPLIILALGALLGLTGIGQS